MSKLILAISILLLSAASAQAQVKSMTGKEFIKYLYDSMEGPRAGRKWDGSSAFSFAHTTGRSGGINSTRGGYADLINKMTGKCTVEIKYKQGLSYAEIAVYDSGWVGDEQVRFYISFAETIQTKFGKEMFLPKGVNVRVKINDGKTESEMNMETNGTKDYVFSMDKRLPPAQWQQIYGFTCNMY